MKHVDISIAAALLCVSLVGVCMGATRVVDPAGGGYSTTITGAISGLSAGDEVVIKAGTYRESVIVKGIGTSSAPIVIRAEDGAEGQVIIKGSDVYTSWTEDTNVTVTGGKAYKTPVTYSFQKYISSGVTTVRTEMVFVDGQLLTRVDTLAELAVGKFYVPTRWTVDNPPASSDLYIALATGTTPAGVTIEISVRQVGLVLYYTSYPTTSEYVHLKGLTVMHVVGAVSWNPNVAEGGAIQIHGAQNCRIENCTATWNSLWGCGFGGLNNTAIDCNFDYNGICGMSGGPQSCTVENTTTSYNSWHGISVTVGHNGGMKWVGNHQYIRNNTFKRIVSSHNDGPGLWFDWTAGGSTIEQCVFDDNLKAGLKIEAMYRTHGGFTVRNNIFSNTRDGGNTSQEYGVGVLLYEASSCDIYNNTIVGNDKSGINFCGGERTLKDGETAINSYNKIHNNIFALNGVDAVHLHTWGGSWGFYDTTHQLDYNLYYDESADSKVIHWRTDPTVYTSYADLTVTQFRDDANHDNAVHSLFGNPKFTNITTSDLGLDSTSKTKTIDPDTK